MVQLAAEVSREIVEERNKEHRRSSLTLKSTVSSTTKQH
jgi:hypothetical protein